MRRFAAVLLAAGLSLTWPAAHAEAATALPQPPSSAVLSTAQVVLPGHALVSPPSGEWLGMTDSGNLVLFRRGWPLWQSHTAGHPGARLVLTEEGDLVVTGPGWRPYWQTYTAGHPGDRLEITDTGNLDLVAADGNVLWAPTIVPNTSMNNPATNQPESAAANVACTQNPFNPVACNQAMLTLIDAAHAAEGIGPLRLPTNFEQLSTIDQLVVAANAERTARGLAAMAPSTVLDGYAQAGAVAGTDPTGPNGYGWAATWEEGWSVSLAAIWNWMYADGPGSDNIDCTPTDPNGCWGHRHNILAPYSQGGIGAGFTTVSNGVPSMSLLLVNDWPGWPASQSR